MSADLCNDRDITIKISDRRHQEAKAFLDFLQRAAKKHSVAFSVSSPASGEFQCFVPFKELERFDLFLQELMVDLGLYYYLCSVPNRREVERSVVRPIFRELLETHFQFLDPSLLRRHLLEGVGRRMAGEFADSTSQEYEKLFQQQKLKLISGYEFIRNLDDLLTAFMLFQLGYKKGQKSPNFNILVDQCGKMDMRFSDPKIRKLFNQVHSLRTRGLHRMEREIPDSELSQIAMQMYVFFEYLDDYFLAQEEKTVKISGKRYRRIRYGNEIRYWGLSREEKVEWQERVKTQPCGDCGVVRGELHLDGCDIEVCPRCSGQYLGCKCRLLEDEDV